MDVLGHPRRRSRRTRAPPRPPAAGTKSKAVACYLAYRRDGGETHNPDRRVSLAVTQSLRAGGRDRALADDPDLHYTMAAEIVHPARRVADSSGKPRTTRALSLKLPSPSCGFAT